MVVQPVNNKTPTILAGFAATMRRQATWVLVLLAAVTLLAAYGASRSRIDNSLEVWQSADSPDWQAYQRFIKRTGLVDPLIIFIPRQLEALDLDELLDALDAVSGVDFCQSVDLLTHQQTRATLLSLTPISGSSPGQLAGILAQVPLILEKHGLKTFHLGGVWYLTNRLDTLSAQATTLLFPVVLLVVVVVVFFLCRTHVVLIVGCGLISALLLVGCIGLAAVKMNMVLLALPPLTLILGMSHAIHFSIKKWRPDDSAISLFCRVAPPCVLSGVTTAMGFASLLFSSYQPVRELGLWGAVGTFLSLGVTFVLVPIFLRPARFARRLVLPADMARFLVVHRRKFYIFFSLLLLVAVIGLGRLEKGSLILNFFTADSPVRLNYQAIENAGVGLSPVEVDLFQKPLSRKTLAQPLQELARLHPEITHYLFTMTDHSRQVESLDAQMLVPVDASEGGDKVERMTLLVKTLSSEQSLALADAVERFFQSRLGASPIPYVTGSVPLYTRGQKKLFSSMLQSFSVAFFSIALLIGFLLRSVKMGLIAMVPNILPVILVVSIMGWFAIPLSVATITVASIIFGVVVDDTIHLLYCYQGQDTALKPRPRMERVFREVGAPVLTTTLVTGTGFLAFLASPFIPLAYFGLLISLALWMALLCDLSVLPILLIGGDDAEL